MNTALNAVTTKWVNEMIDMCDIVIILIYVTGTIWGCRRHN